MFLESQKIDPDRLPNGHFGLHNGDSEVCFRRFWKRAKGSLVLVLVTVDQVTNGDKEFFKRLKVVKHLTEERKP